MNDATIEKAMTDVDVFKILNSVNIGIWIMEYSPNKQIFRLYGNRSFMHILGIGDDEKMTAEQCYRYWYSRIDVNYRQEVHRAIDNIIGSFDRHTVMADEVYYIWHKDGVGAVHIRCGGRVVSYEDEIYKICGYYQDYTSVMKMRDYMRNENSLKLKNEIESINYLKDYYQELAYIDELTGMANRRGFLDKARWLIEHKMRRKSDELWIGLLDIDFFKRVNDTYGHLNGDIVLKSLGRILLNMSIDNSNIYVFRYGGEEFIIMIHQHQKHEVEQMMNECRRQVRSFPICIDEGRKINITCSIGIAKVERSSVLTTAEQVHCTLQKADMLLYKAKQSGRDKVCIE